MRNSGSPRKSAALKRLAKYQRNISNKKKYGKSGIKAAWRNDKPESQRIFSMSVTSSRHGS